MKFYSFFVDDKPVNADEILSLALNSLFAFIEILIVSHPMRILHIIQPISFGLIYGLFSFIYYKCNGVNR